MDIEQTFGKFLLEKRLERDVSARQIAAKLNVSAVYICDIEKDRRVAPKGEMLEQIAEFLKLSKVDTELMYDLAAKSKNSISADLPEYIMNNGLVRVALRTAKEHDVDDKEWMDFIERIKKKSTEG